MKNNKYIVKLFAWARKLKIDRIKRECRVVRRDTGDLYIREYVVDVYGMLEYSTIKKTLYDIYIIDNDRVKTIAKGTSTNVELWK